MIGPGINLLQVAVNQASGGFSPLSLFASGEEGAWYDPSDLSTMFQDAAGTVPVTADSQPVRLILDKSGRNNHAPAPSDAARPLYRTAGGLHWLLGDGVEDDIGGLSLSITGNRAVACAIERIGVGTGSELNQVTGWYGGSGFYAGFSSNGTPSPMYRVNDIGGSTSGQTVVAPVTAAKYVGVGSFGSAAAGEANGISFGAVLQGALNRAGTSIRAFGDPSLTLVANRACFGLIALSRTFTAGEVDALNAYFAAKAGVTIA